MTIELLEHLEQTGLSTAIRESPSIFPWLEVIHVMAISGVLGSILLVDTRLLGVASIRMRVSGLSAKLLPLTWAGFALAVISGALLFLSRPTSYFHVFAFRLKMLMLIAAGLNMAVFHLVTQRDLPRWDRSVHPPVAARVAGALSIAIWIAITAAGRWIGFS